MLDLRRRALITMLGGVIVAWPTAVRAQQSYRLGILTGRSREEPNFVAFFEELRRLGIVEGQQLTVDPRGFKTREDRYPALALELITSGVDAILAAGDAAIAAAQADTRTIPIVGISDDMVGAGFVRSLARPGGNITGVSILAPELNSKRLELLMDALTDARRIAVLSDSRIMTPKHLSILRYAAQSRDVVLTIYEASTPEEIAPAIEAAHKAGAQALNVLASPLFSFNSQEIVDKVASLRLPAIYQWPEIAEQGGLLAYGPRITQTYRQMARQLIRLIRGAKMVDTPVEQPTVFELLANLKTARAMNLQLPEAFLTRADGIME
jgi:putative tryptophan/tyrosine transport system substrate-binding protein